MKKISMLLAVGLVCFAALKTSAQDSIQIVQPTAGATVALGLDRQITVVVFSPTNTVLNVGLIEIFSDGAIESPVILAANQFFAAGYTTNTYTMPKNGHAGVDDYLLFRYDVISFTLASDDDSTNAPSSGIFTFIAVPPLSVTVRLRLMPATNDCPAKMYLHCVTLPNVNYDVEESTNTIDWNIVSPYPLSDPSGIFNFQIMDCSAAGAHFYRLVEDDTLD